MEEVLYYIEPKESFEAEGRYFYKGEKYPVLKKNEEYSLFTSENGNFNFSNKIVDQVIEQWDLIVHNEKEINLDKERPTEE